MLLRLITGTGVLLRIEVRAELNQFGRVARSYARILLAIRTAPRSPDRPQSRCVDIALATDWLVHLLRLFLGGTRLTRSVVFREVGTTPW